MEKGKQQAKTVWEWAKRTAQGLTMICASGALTMGLLAACAAQPSEPTVTRDDLTPPSTVQQVLAEDAGSGKNFAYEWWAEDVETGLARYEEEWERDLQAQLDRFREASEDLRAAGYESLEQAETAMRKMREDVAADVRSALEAEHAIDPVVSAQEAANRACVACEEAYGVDLSDATVSLGCNAWEVETGKRVLWLATIRKESDNAERSLMVELDGTTGEIARMNYGPSAEEQEDWNSGAPPACFVQRAGFKEGVGTWNEDDPSFAPMAERLKKCLTQALSGSVLTGGAQVTELRVVLEGSTDEDGVYDNWLGLYADCDNGRTYRLFEACPTDSIYTDTEAEPFPLRRFFLVNTAYDPV